MKKAIISTLMLLSLSVGVQAANDHYLTYEQTPDSLKLLPPPPSYTSIDFLRDKAWYDEGKSLRNTERGKQAHADADVTKDSLLNNFAEAFGSQITKEKTPQIFTLITTMKEDAGEYATRSAKKHYNRIRPFAFFNEPTCRPEDEKMLSTNGSYPSGHTAIGWSVALILAEINPARQNEILKRGYELGQSRVICGYHWQSDVDAARVVASSVVATLHTNPDFVSQLAKAKQEMKTLKKQ
ncbi:acid phosphatase [Chania multitudinisentens RB-25]|uniref:Acid phosphatase n=1 Tax=Chania multitudinisentens RB-25 TaxID=1441930 RepID=W0L8J5_9GAMM|nr:phosphatase PAP2 family protein [Chania multitudinisentens]AHG18582.1 acid phosphatase [Chania multitudinisentens RB-25]